MQSQARPGQPGGYPPQQGGYPPQQGGYPPQQGAAPGGYPPQQGGYPPQQGGYPPQQGGYPPQQGGYPPQQGGAPGGAGMQSYGSQYYYNQIPPNELQQLQAWFAAVDKDKSGEITASELQQMNFNGTKFSAETANMLVKVFDKDKSGQISFNEYAALHKFITSMQGAYQMYDRDRSGSIDLNEVTQAVQQGGFYLNPQTLQIVYNRFLRSPTLNPQGRLKGLNLELFLQLCAFLGALRSGFSQYDYNRSGWIQINLDQLVLIASGI
jgi:Ca2+-binding EF-hand superfamily protein